MSPCTYLQHPFHARSFRNIQPFVLLDGLMYVLLLSSSYWWENIIMAYIAPTWHLAWTWGCSKGSVLISSFNSLSNLWGKYYCSSSLRIWAPRSRTGKKFVQGHFAREGQSYAVFPYYTLLPYRKQGLETVAYTGSLWLRFTRGFSTISGSNFGPENPFIEKS